MAEIPDEALAEIQQQSDMLRWRNGELERELTNARTLVERANLEAAATSASSATSVALAEDEARGDRERAEHYQRQRDEARNAAKRAQQFIDELIASGQATADEWAAAQARYELGRDAERREG